MEFNPGKHNKKMEQREKDDCYTVNQKIGGLPSTNSTVGIVLKPKNGSIDLMFWMTKKLVKRETVHRFQKCNKQKKKKTGSAGSLQMQLVRSSAGQPGWLQTSSSASARGMIGIFIIDGNYIIIQGMFLFRNRLSLRTPLFSGMFNAALNGQIPL